MPKGRPPTDPKVKADEDIEREVLVSRILEKKNSVKKTWPEFIDYYKLGVSESAITKFKGGASSLATVKKVHDKIYGKSENSDSQITNSDVGSYNRAEYAFLEGNYALVRPSVHEINVIYAYIANIEWNSENKTHYLKLKSPGSILEIGKVHLLREHQSLCVHFNDKHYHGLLMIRIVPGERNLYGILTSILPSLSKNHFSPTSVPIVLVKEIEKLRIGSGYINNNHYIYNTCLAFIKDVANKDIVLDGWWTK